MTNSLTLLGTLGLLIVLSLGLVAVHHTNAEAANRPAGEIRKTSPGFGPHRLFKFIHRLDLSRDQREQIGEIMDQHRPVMRTYMLDMMDAKKELQTILSNADYDPKAIEDLARVHAKNTEEIFVTSAKAFAEVGALLTPEQRQQLAERMAKRRGHGWGHKWGKHRRDHGPDAEPGPESL